MPLFSFQPLFLAALQRYIFLAFAFVLAIGKKSYQQLPFSLCSPSATVESLLTITYYDGYQQLTTANGFNGLGFLASGIIAFCDNDGNTNGYYDSVRGQVTGTRVKVLDGSEHTTSAIWLATATYYDDRYRPIQSRGTLYDGATGGMFTSSTRYRFNGLVEQVAESQTLNGVNTERNTLI